MKSTEPNFMVLVSFSSAEDALSNDVKKYTTFRMQGTENPPFHFLGTPGIDLQDQQRLARNQSCEMDLTHIIVFINSKNDSQGQHYICYDNCAK